MTKTEQIFFAILRSALSDKSTTLSDYGKISLDEWNNVYKLSTAQGVMGVMLSAIEKLPKNQVPNLDLLMEWLGQTEYITTNNNRYCKDAEELIAFFRRNGLDVIVLKGLACAKYYPLPQRRSLGDFDIFLVRGRKPAYKEGNDLCSRLGIQVDLHDYKHSHIKYKSLMVENHQYCTEIRGSNVRKQFERHLQKLLLDGNEVQFNALFLMAHAMNHFLDEGLSLRQICDWAMYLKSEQNNVDWQDFYSWMEITHERRFADALNSICVKYLGIAITNKNIVTDSTFTDKILYDALYGKMDLHGTGLHGWRYRKVQLKNTFAGAWKYRDLCQQNVFMEYLLGIWYYMTEKNPKI